jgi:hypothetical protein
VTNCARKWRESISRSLSAHGWPLPTRLDYTEALDWFGLRFQPGEGKQTTWRLEIRADGTVAQAARLQAWLAKAGS